MPAIGKVRNYDKKFLFAVEIDGLEVAWFTKAGPLEAEADVVEVNEGGNIRVANKSPGKVKYTDLVLVAGVTDNKELWDWFQLTYNAADNSGEPEEGEKKNLTIAQKKRDGKVARRYPVYNAWVKKYKGGDWDGGASEASMEEVTLVYDYFKREEGAV